LNARNVDALVARGAAFANQSRFQEAVNDFERALGKLVSELFAQVYSGLDGSVLLVRRCPLAP
jgi:hypothetical protein